jgi:glucoamylase
MLEYLEEKILIKILDNCNYSKKKGMIIASPSNDPPYKFHWIRDSALVMRVFIDLYNRTKDDKFLLKIIDYVENENQIQNLETLTHLGEPKIRIDRTPYDDPWGRPQNDGPALRGINMVKIYNMLKKDYKILANGILEIIKKDLKYIIENYDKPCFDLWEEYFGWHFYTRIVQLKFLKECMKLDKILGFENIKDTYDKLLTNFKHHIQSDHIISSYDVEGNVSKVDDASILLGLSHIEYDNDIMNLFDLELFLKNCDNLLKYFREKYDRNDLNMIGRYIDDKYYDGQIWIICTLGLLQYYIKLSENNKFEYLKSICKDVFNYIISIDINLDIAEQYNPVNNQQLSAEKLTWNYSELYITFKDIKRL